MLTTLNLKDFVIVDQLSLDLSSGFTVLTGETGAGKSILIDAIQLIRGGRGDADLVRQGCERANIIAEFSLGDASRHWLEENDLLETGAGSVLVRRAIDRSGRSRAWINGISVTLSQLRELGDTLTDIQGQHAHQLLLKSQCQLKLLDAYADDAAILSEVKNAHAEWSAAARRLEEATSGADIRTARIEQLNWLLEDLDARLKNISETLTTAAELIDDAAGDLENILDRTDTDGARFEKVDRRVSRYFNLARKYRTEPEMLYQLEAESRKRLEELRGEENLEALREAEALARKAYDAKAKLLTQARRSAAEKFSRAVTEEMQQLSMKGGRFEVALEACAPSEHGSEQCEFLMAGHPGVDVSPLAKVASGGELSRIGLAIFTLSSRNTTVPTLIFDEVDSGVGGATGEVVGRMMKKLGESRQVLCVTHLPQVAACGDHHLKVEKISDGFETVSYLKELFGQARVDEIARMLGGLLITQKTKVLAEEMVRAGEVS